jgi:SAM-dependent methyltransferase
MADAAALRQGVWEAYTAVAERPTDESRFRVGRQFAEGLGYPPDQLERLPAVSVEAFTGVSNVAVLADLRVGDLVLDVGCGAGLDALIAAERVGPAGRVIGLDFSPAMLARARQGAAGVGLTNTLFCQAAAERLSLPDGSVDTALVNGLFNLNPARAVIFQELARAVRPGGMVFAAELILMEGAGVTAPASLDDWFS